MDLVKSTANDAVNEMIAEWRPSWRRPFIAMMEGHPEDNQYNFTWYLENFSRPELNVNIITMPNVVNNQVVIRFRIGQEMIGQFIREVDKMDYSAFKDEFFNLYATQIEAKLNKLS